VLADVNIAAGYDDAGGSTAAIAHAPAAAKVDGATGNMQALVVVGIIPRTPEETDVHVTVD
jgi:hypothetical protein